MLDGYILKNFYAELRSLQVNSASVFTFEDQRTLDPNSPPKSPFIMVPCVQDNEQETGPYGKPPGVVSYSKPPNQGVYFD